MHYFRSLGRYKYLDTLRDKMKEFTSESRFTDDDLGKRVAMYIKPEEGSIGDKLGADMLVNGRIREIYDDGFLLGADIVRVKGVKYDSDNKIFYESIKTYCFED